MIGLLRTMKSVSRTMGYVAMLSKSSVKRKDIVEAGKGHDNQ